MRQRIDAVTEAMLGDWDRLIRNTAVQSYVRLQEQYGGRLPFEADDFIQAGRIAVWRLAELDADAPYGITTYITNTVKWRCADLVRTHTGRGNARHATTFTVPYDKSFGDDEDGHPLVDMLADPTGEQEIVRVEEELDADGRLSVVAEVVAGLSERDQAIVRARIEGETMDAIARAQKITGARVSQILMRLRARLRRRGL